MDVLFRICKYKANIRNLKTMLTLETDKSIIETDLNEAIIDFINMRGSIN
jgi:hypothetical protein